MGIGLQSASGMASIRFRRLLCWRMVMEKRTSISAADGDHERGRRKAAVGAHRELPAGPSVAHPPHRFTQEVGGAAGGVGAALPQPGHQHVAGAGGDGQQRVIAPLAGIAVVACALLGQAVGLADGGIEVNGQRPVAGSRPGLPRPGPAARGSPGPVDGRGPN